MVYEKGFCISSVLRYVRISLKIAFRGHNEGSNRDCPLMEKANMVH